MLLELRNVSRSFPGVQALDDVCFDLRAGEVHALVGENGAGKSTLINVVSGVFEPDVGKVLLEGQLVRLADPVAARRLGIVTVHQEAELFGDLSVAENMALMQGVPTRYIRYPASSSHGLSRGGPPDLRIHRIKEILRWYAEYL